MYCSSKFAIEGLTFALAEEIAPFGLHAMVVQPGYFRTGFLKNVNQGGAMAEEMEIYRNTPAGAVRGALKEMHGMQIGDPVKGALRMWEGITGEGLAKGKKLRLRLPLGTDTGATMRAKAIELRDTADEWEDVWSSTDFEV